MPKSRTVEDRVRSVLRKANHSRRPVRENPDNFVGAIVDATLNRMSGVIVDLTQGFVLHFGPRLYLRFSDAGEVPVATQELTFPVQKYTVSANVIKLREMYFQLFYNSDHVVIHRHIKNSYRNFMARSNLPVVKPSKGASDTNTESVNLTLEFDAALKHRMAECAAWDGLTLEEWAVAAFRKYVISTPEPMKIEHPAAAPGGELYQHRGDRSEKAPAFIARLYGHLLDGNFLRSDLRKLDPKAEMALRNLERVNGRCDLNIPTKKERNDKIVAEGRLLADDPMETMRRISAAAYRQR